jgi:hypothetical protein
MLGGYSGYFAVGLELGEILSLPSALSQSKTALAERHKRAIRVLVAGRPSHTAWTNWVHFIFLPAFLA